MKVYLPLGHRTATCLVSAFYDFAHKYSPLGPVVDPSPVVSTPSGCLSPSWSPHLLPSCGHQPCAIPPTTSTAHMLGPCLLLPPATCTPTSAPHSACVQLGLAQPWRGRLRHLTSKPCQREPGLQWRSKINQGTNRPENVCWGKLPRAPGEARWGRGAGLVPQPFLQEAFQQSWPCWTPFFKAT